jgi:hypothetical protein
MDIQVLDNTYRSEIKTGQWQMVSRLLNNPGVALPQIRAG